MSDFVGSLSRRTAAAVCLTLTIALPAVAQQPLGMATAPTQSEFLSRFDFNVSAARLAKSDPRFAWDTHWAADFDLVDYVSGRVSFLADYQALVGSEFHPFDPYQSHYTLEAMGSARAKGMEFVGVLNHVSRHLGDRANRMAIAENSLGLRVMRRSVVQGTTLDLRADVRKVVARAYVDYTWMTQGDFTVRHPFSPRAALYSRVMGQYVTVKKAIANRSNQTGGRLEAGVRVAGTGANAEFFAGAERLYDADPLDRQPQSWAFVGFRVIGK